jgi:site-specific recombinases, DNA invertase pin homologs
MDKALNKVAIYIRVSTTHQIDRDSIPMQKSDLIAYTKLMLNTEDYVIFEDAGYSGKNTDRPNFQKMMSQIRSGAFTHLLVWKIDRISRNLLDFSSMYKELKELGVVFVSKNEQFDTSTAMGEAMLKIILVFAELERNITSERVTATMISRASNGQWNGGRVPFGYDYDYDSKTFSVNEQESVIVKLIHDKYEEMQSLVQEARYLNEHDFRTREGNEWSPVTLLIILRNIFYCGDYQYNTLKEGNRQKVKDESEWVIVESHHDAIISREQKQRIIGLLESNKRLSRRNKSTKYNHVFAGLLFCSGCGKAMGGSPATPRKGWSYSKYSCYSTRKNALLNCKSTSDAILGEFVFNYILNILNAKKASSSFNSYLDLEKMLLSGISFSNISGIKKEGLTELYNMMQETDKNTDIFGKPKKSSGSKNISELSKLRTEKKKTEIALDRLTNLFLFSDKALSEKEYLIQKEKLIGTLDDINEKIGIINSNEWHQTISDTEFIKRASEFVLAKKLADRKYISYKSLALSIDAAVLKAFLARIIDSITVGSGRVEKIVFKNGIVQEFIYKQ